MKNEVTREDARQILKKGILDMNVARLIQMSHFGLMGNIVLSNKIVSVENVSIEGRDTYMRVHDRAIILQASMQGVKAELKTLSGKRKHPFALENIQND